MQCAGSEERIPKSVADLMIRSAREIGVDVGTLLRRARLTDLLEGDASYDTRSVPKVRFLPVYRECSRAIGFHVAAQEGRKPYTDEDFFLLCACIIHCETLQDVINTQIKFVDALDGRAGRARLQMNEDEAIFVADSNFNATAHALLCELIGLATFSRLFGWLIDSPLSGLRLTLKYKRPETHEALGAIVDCPIAFEAAENAIRFDRSMLDKPVVRSYRDLHKMLEREPLEFMPLSDRSPLSTKLELKIRRLLRDGDGVPTLKEAADLMGLSHRTFCRHLAQENCSFHAIVQKCRMERALQLLQEDHLTVEEIATTLGFQESRSFSRFMKVELGCNPSEYRQSIRVASQS